MGLSVIENVSKQSLVSSGAFQKILEAISLGEPMVKACRLVSIKPMDFLRWLDANPSYQTEMSRARTIGHDVMAESLLTIHEDIEDVAKARLASDNKKWLLARVASSKYGDKLEMNVNGSIDLNAALNAAQQRLIRDSATTIEGETVEYRSVEHYSDTDNKSDINDLLD